MRIISAFRQAPERALATARRFPVVLLAGAFLAGTIMLEADDAAGERLLFTALLSIIVAFDLTLLKERLRLKEAPGQLGVLALTAATLALIFWSIDVLGRQTRSSSGVIDTYPVIAVDEPIRLAAIGLALHALAAVLPFIGRRSLTGFWEYNRTLFERALASALFSGVLFGGLAVALWAMDVLLGAEISGDTFTYLFGLMAGVVNTWFFLVGVPPARQFEESEAEARQAGVYPRGLKVFVQFVLLPLTAVYLVILYLYVAKITLEWNLPQGQVSYLIFSYAVLGILAYLLIYPLRDDEENRWIRSFARGFFIALAPLLVVLVIALMRRIGDYGLTEPRYYGIALAVWLAIITVYFLTRREDIRVIPTTLGVFALLTTFGVWGATSIAVRSQVAQLAEIMERPRPYDEQQSNTIRSIADFLAERGRIDAAAELVSTRPDTVTTPADLVAALGVAPGWLSNDPAATALHFPFDRGSSIDIDGYSEMIEIPGMFDSIATTSPTLGPLVVRWRTPGVLSIEAAGSRLALRLDSIALALSGPDLSPVLDTSAAAPVDAPSRGGQYGPPPPVTAANDSLRARLVIYWMSGTKPSDTVATATEVSGILLVGRVKGAQ